METMLLLRNYQIIGNIMAMSISFADNVLQVKFEVDNKEIYRLAITRDRPDLLETIMPVIGPEICRVILHNTGLDGVSISIDGKNLESIARFASFVGRFLNDVIDLNSGAVYDSLRSHQTTRDL